MHWVRVAIVVVAVLGGLTAAAYAFLIHPMLLRGRQIENLVDMRMYAVEIDRFRKTHGLYPASVQAAIRESPDLRNMWPYHGGLDRWGHRILYRSDGQRYLLVSYGRDGLPDGSDYEAMRAAGGLQNETCSDLNADIVFSDRGELRNCGK